MNYNTFSNYFGLIANKKFPKFIQNFLNQAYVRIFDINLNEFEVPNDGFESLNELFTRCLKIQRELGDGFISPSDGKILECGVGDKLVALSIKGCEYKVDELLGESLDKDELKNGFDYANIYLSPKDYHHYHSPCDLQILSSWYKKGSLFSVSPKTLLKVPNLYAKNERVILKTVLPNNKLLWIVFVGALNVGKMRFCFDEKIQTNANLGDAFYKYENLFVQKGERLGNFELGSTIILISQNGAVKYNQISNQQVKFGQNLAQI